jgi:hypothetical protein
MVYVGCRQGKVRYLGNVDVMCIYNTYNLNMYILGVYKLGYI